MTVIHKQVLPLQEEIFFTCNGFQFLDIQAAKDTFINQGGKQVEAIAELWYETNPEPENNTTVRLQIVGTGHPVPENAEYLGTVKPNNYFVWHIYLVGIV